jgi:4-hydroxy-tetrahydrodipicolinate reductase
LASVAELASGTTVLDIDAVREGEVIGDHTITFEFDDDVLTIHHSAKSRDIFAKGAIVAAKFIQNQSPGLYNMQDVLGLNHVS